MTNYNLEPHCSAPGEYGNDWISNEALNTPESREYGQRDQRLGAVRGVGRFAIGEFPTSWQEQSTRDIDPSHYDSSPRPE